MKKLLVLIAVGVLLALTGSITYAATVLPQLEKISDVMANANKVDARLSNNNNIEVSYLQPMWERAAYNFVASALGLELPHPSDPDNRDEALYVKSNQGWCDEVVAGNPEEATRNCKHTLAIARSSYAGFQFFDLFAVHYINPNGWQAVNMNDVFHERAVACENIQVHIDIMWGSEFDFDAPGHEADKLLRDAYIAKRIQGIEHNLNAAYKAMLKDHIENNTFVEFYSADGLSHETLLTHPNGVNCELE